MDSPVPTKLIRPFYADWSLWTLLASNLWVLALSVVQQWPLIDILWTYWFQSVTIVLFAFLRILTFKNSTDTKSGINGRPTPLMSGDRSQFAFWFIVIFGFAHLAFACMFRVWSNQTQAITAMSAWPVIVAAAVFFANHLFSFVYNRKWDNATKLDMHSLIVSPFLRIIPVVVTFIFGLPLGLIAAGEFHPQVSGTSVRWAAPYETLAHSTVVIVFFMLLKTWGDATMHIVEARRFGIQPGRSTK
jgi:hypothetical protein